MPSMWILATQAGWYKLAQLVESGTSMEVLLGNPREFPNPSGNPISHSLQ
jgi:hypothetical protein